MRCFFCENLDGKTAVLSKQEEYHLFKVLRAETGKTLLLIDGNGKIAEGFIDNKIIRINKTVQYSIPEKKIHLFTALPRKNRLDNLLSQCTEAGVWAFHPVICERSVVVPKKINMTDKWTDKLIEACKQAHNPFIPKVYKPKKISDAFNYIIENNMVSYYGSTKNNSSNKIIENKSDIAWFVGPEGGFTDEEESLMTKLGIKGISIGNWIMRVETAALAGVLLLQR